MIIPNASEQRERRQRETEADKFASYNNKLKIDEQEIHIYTEYLNLRYKRNLRYNRIFKRNIYIYI